MLGQEIFRVFEFYDPCHSFMSRMRSILTSMSGSIQGWDHCVCLDLNAFYLGLVSEEERCRVANLELFDEHEVSCDVIGF